MVLAVLLLSAWWEITAQITASKRFYHEQSRPDRDNFIYVNEKNLLPNTSDNFIKAMEKYIHEATAASTYDFGSVMHYSSFAFASNKSVPTIVPQRERGWDGFQWTIGQRQQPSFLDYLQINHAYCGDSCPSKLGCHHGGYPNPNQCSECLCPSGFSGQLCEEVEISHQCHGAGYLRVTTTPRVLSTPNYPREFSNDSECIWLLTAEPGFQIHYQVVGTIGLHCEAACDETFLEIKVIMLRNNGRNSDKGFQIRYWAQPAPKQPSLSIGNICLFLEATAGIKPCRNGGTCIPFGAAAAFHCQCQPGFTGFTCQIDVNECENSPCQNGGTCSDRVNSYECSCPESFTGINCEHKIDACASDPCKNEGRCQNKGAGFVCSCAPNFAGPTCQLKSRCGWLRETARLASICHNGGTCTDDGDNHQCHCAPHFTGLSCETRIPHEKPNASYRKAQEVCAKQQSECRNSMAKKESECQQTIKEQENECKSCQKAQEACKKEQSECQKEVKKQENECRQIVSGWKTKLATCNRPKVEKGGDLALIGGSYSENNKITIWNYGSGESRTYSPPILGYGSLYPGASARLRNGSVLLCGGNNLAAYECHLYDLKPKVKVTDAGRSTFAHYNGAAVTLIDGRYVACGGALGPGGGNGMHANCSVFAKGKWSSIPSMLEPRIGFGLVAVGNYIYAIGGYGVKSGNGNLNSAERYSIAHNKWTKLPSMPGPPRAYLSAVYFNERIYVSGGNNNGYHGRKVYFTDIDIYDIKTNTWSSGPFLNIARLFHTSIVINNQIWIIGGRTRNPSSKTSIEILYKNGKAWKISEKQLPRYFEAGFVALL